MVAAATGNAVAVRLNRDKQRRLRRGGTAIGAHWILPGGGYGAAAKVSRMTPIRLRWWEVALLILPALLSVVVLLGGQIGAGIVLTALVAVVIASRAEVRERNIAGGYARTRGYLQLAKAVALLSIYCVVIGLFFVIQGLAVFPLSPGASGANGANARPSSL
jgi:hypothetical protein